METKELIGVSPKFRALLDEVNLVAKVDSTVLIQGATGTGKELIARAIHEAGPRRGNRFVALNCAAIPATLLENELFGSERGAFTGAVAQTIGRLQAADRGTLFLDEIGELPLELQPKLLRALQERQFELSQFDREARQKLRWHGGRQSDDSRTAVSSGVDAKGKAGIWRHVHQPRLAGRRGTEHASVAEASTRVDDAKLV